MTEALYEEQRAFEHLEEQHERFMKDQRNLLEDLVREAYEESDVPVVRIARVAGISHHSTVKRWVAKSKERKAEREATLR